MTAPLFRGMLRMGAANAAPAAVSATAVTKSAALIPLTPKAFDDLRNRGIAAHNKKKHKVAILLLVQVLAYEPNDIACLQMLGASYNAIGDFEKSLAMTDRVIQMNPADGGTILMRARMFSKLGMLNKVREANETLVRYDWVDGSFTLLHVIKSPEMLGDPQKSMATLRSGIARYPRCGALYMELFELLARRENYPEALFVAQELYKNAPKYSSDWRVGKNKAAMCESCMNNLTAAMKEYNDALTTADNKGKPLNPIPAHVLREGLMGRAHLYNGLGKPDKSAADVTYLLSHHRPEINFYLQRSIFYERAKQDEKALADLTTVTQLNLNALDAYLKRFKVLSRLKRYTEALSVVDMLIVHNPDDSELFMDRGDLWAVQSEYTKAVADYTKAISIERNEMRFYNKRAAAYRKLGKEEFAKRDEAFSKQLLDR